ncbi:UNVERIFIED_CONTAM: hypothetical protein Sradi_3860600 [Sesamum radiatum]|uniref:Uncharacterized protein n=1 Tax=Sesamum radiatum TaxID=300843 RepID=A0AAW2Q225_SESRA
MEAEVFHEVGSHPEEMVDRFSGPLGFNRGSTERSTFSTPSIGSSRGTGQSGGRGSTFVQNCFTCGRRHSGSCRRLDDIAKTCYNCGEGDT